MVDEMIETVRAAFAPGADAATKQRAASILRGLIGVLEAGVVGVPAEQPGPFSTPAPQPERPGGADVLTAIVEYVRPHLPEDALAQMPRLRMPLIDFHARIDKR